MSWWQRSILGHRGQIMFSNIHVSTRLCCIAQPLTLDPNMSWGHTSTRGYWNHLFCFVFVLLCFVLWFLFVFCVFLSLFVLFCVFCFLLSVSLLCGGVWRVWVSFLFFFFFFFFFFSFFLALICSLLCPLKYIFNTFVPYNVTTFVFRFQKKKKKKCDKKYYVILIAHIMHFLPTFCPYFSKKCYIYTIVECVTYYVIHENLVFNSGGCFY